MTNSVTITPLDGYAGSPTVTFPLLPTALRITPNPISVGELLSAQSIGFADHGRCGGASRPAGRERPGVGPLRAVRLLDLRRRRSGRRLRSGHLACDDRAHFRRRTEHGHGVPGPRRLLSALQHHGHSHRPSGRRHGDAGFGRPRGSFVHSGRLHVHRRRFGSRGGRGGDVRLPAVHGGARDRRRPRSPSSGTAGSESRSSGPRSTSVREGPRARTR